MRRNTGRKNIDFFIIMFANVVFKCHSQLFYFHENVLITIYLRRFFIITCLLHLFLKNREVLIIIEKTSRQRKIHKRGAKETKSVYAEF